MPKTDNLELELPELNEYVDVEVLNNNFEIIDSEITKISKYRTFKNLSEAVHQDNLKLDDIVTTLGLVSVNDGKGRSYIIKSSNDGNNIVYKNGMWFNDFNNLVETKVESLENMDLQSKKLDKGAYNGTAQDLKHLIDVLATSGSITPIELDLIQYRKSITNSSMNDFKENSEFVATTGCTDLPQGEVANVIYKVMGNGLEAFQLAVGLDTKKIYFRIFNVSWSDYIVLENSQNKGQSNGYAPLNENSVIPSEHLPSYVDDIIEGYYDDINKIFYAEATHVTVINGETGKIYLDLTSGTNQYRWSGTAFTFLGTGQPATTISNGLMSSSDKTKLDGIATNANKVEHSTVNGNILVNGIETKVYSEDEIKEYIKKQAILAAMLYG